MLHWLYNHNKRPTREIFNYSCSGYINTLSVSESYKKASVFEDKYFYRQQMEHEITIIDHLFLFLCRQS